MKNEPTSPLPLDSPRWSALSHAYGSAKNVPGMLRRFRMDGYGEASDDDLLWGHLCHQGTIYTATFAAAPHVMCRVDEQPIEGQVMLVVFMASVCASADTVHLMEDLRPAFEQSLADAGRKAMELLQQHRLSDSDFAYLLGAAAALHGNSDDLHTLEFALSNGELNAACPECGSQILFETESVPFEARLLEHDDQKPLMTSPTKPVDPPTVVTPREPPVQPWPLKPEASQIYDWLYGAARRSGHIEIAEKMRSLFGNATCPKCHAEIDLRAASKLI